MIAAALGIALALAIGAGCRWFEIPLPAPTKLVGALLVLAMTLGFISADLYLKSQDPELIVHPANQAGDHEHPEP